MTIFRTADRPMPEARDGKPGRMDPAFWGSETWARMRARALETYKYCIKCGREGNLTAHLLQSGFDAVKEGMEPQPSDCIVICWECLRAKKEGKDAETQETY